VYFPVFVCLYLPSDNIVNIDKDLDVISISDTMRELFWQLIWILFKNLWKWKGRIYHN